MLNTRVAWANELAQSVWEPRIAAINRAWAHVELESVAENVRAAALVPNQPGLKERADYLGLELTEVNPERFVVTRAEVDGLDFRSLWDARQDDAVGFMLGYPSCCRAVFDRVWNDLKRVDPTPFMGGGDVAGPIEANILGRWLGVRLVPHLPCSFCCGATHRLGTELARFWPAEELGWAREFLSWPVRYSSLHGVVIVTTPVLKVVTTVEVDYVPKEIRIDRPGTSYPAEGASGLGFPFQRTPVIPLTSLKKFTTSMDDPRDNGFQTVEAQDEAHRMLLDELAGQTLKSVIDLGCGNGRLLEKIRADVKVGVEVDPSRARRARARGLDVREGAIKNLAALAPEFYAVAIIAQNRFVEMKSGEDYHFWKWAHDHVLRLLVYSYDEPRSVRWDVL